MDAIEFITKYESYLEEIRKVIKSELSPIIDELLTIDPHDLVKPDTYFMDEIHVQGYVWRLFLQRVKGI